MSYDKDLYNKIINNIAKTVKQAILNEDREDYSENAKQAVHNRVKKAFIDNGYDAHVVSKATQNAHKRANPIEAIENEHLYRNIKKSQADLKLIKPSMPYDDLTGNIAFIMLQQRRQKNHDTFRVELTPELTDIAGNERPSENVTYIAFIDKNLFDTTEMDVYIVPKETLLDVAHEITENGRKTPGNKRIDNFGNWLTLNKTGKNVGLVLKDSWIKNNCIDSYHIDPIPLIMSDNRTYRNY